MLSRLFQNKFSVFMLLLLLSLLVLIRAFEKQLFYDPFLVYFERDYQTMPLPEYDTLELFFGMLYRFFLNSLLSLGILYFLFKDKEMILFTSVLYLLLFIILIGVFFFILKIYDNKGNFLLFYVRRFLIHPLFVVVFVPAFYFQKLKGE